VTPGWPDLVIGGIAVFFAWKGFHNGFVAELAGPVAIIVALIAAFRYPGMFDSEVARYVQLGPGSAHAVGTVVYAVLVYAIVSIIAWVLGRFAKLPVITLINGLAGALVGAAKALLGAWVVLYIVLFLPLPNDLRNDLRRSGLVQLVTIPNSDVDADARTLLPWFVRPFAQPLFQRHNL
jgi:uncharacterized membrane protein required for colicin V production